MLSSFCPISNHDETKIFFSTKYLSSTSFSDWLELKSIENFKTSVNQKTQWKSND